MIAIRSGCEETFNQHNKNGTFVSGTNHLFFAFNI